jgi:hypothetical protein
LLREGSGCKRLRIVSSDGFGSYHIKDIDRKIIFKFGKYV